MYNVGDVVSVLRCFAIKFQVRKPLISYFFKVRKDTKPIEVILENKNRVHQNGF